MARFRLERPGMRLRVRASQWCCRIVAVALLGLFVLQDRPVLAQEAVARWKALNGQILEVYRQGMPGQALPLAQEALAFARQSFGDKDLHTLASLGNLAELLRVQ